jgi:outer membrane protein TolC
MLDVIAVQNAFPASAGFAARAFACVAAVALGLPCVASGQQTPQEALPVDLPTALRLADERNLDIAIYLERIEAASARVAESRTLAAPTIRAGSTYDRHTGNIQETSGNVLDVDRVSQFTGLDLGVGFSIADAVYAPLVARQNRDAVTAAATANRHVVLLDVATTYIGLLRAREETAIVESALARANDLARLTADYAEAGQGLLADAEMAAVQPLVWEQRRLVSAEREIAAAVELVRLLHLESGVTIEPIETAIPLLEIFTGDEDVEALVASALANRPESEQFDVLVAAAEDELNAQRYRLFIPSVALGYSVGEFGGAPGSSIRNTDDRDDLMLSLYFEIDGLGFGQRARADERRSELRRMNLEREKLHDGIAADVREAHARVRSFSRQREFTAAAVERAAQAYRLNRERIFDLQGLPLETLQAMQTLATAELAELDTRAGHAIAQVRLQTMVGRPIDPAVR